MMLACRRQALANATKVMSLGEACEETSIIVKLRRAGVRTREGAMPETTEGAGKKRSARIGINSALRLTAGSRRKLWFSAAIAI